MESGKQPAMGRAPFALNFCEVSVMAKSFAILALVGGKSGAAAAAAAAAAAIHAAIAPCAAHGDMSLLVDTRAAVDGNSARAIVMRAELDRMIAFFRENVMNKGASFGDGSATVLAENFPQAYADAVAAHNAPALAKAKATREANKAAVTPAAAAAAATSVDAVTAAASELDAMKAAHAAALADMADALAQAIAERDAAQAECAVLRDTVRALQAPTVQAAPVKTNKRKAADLAAVA